MFINGSIREPQIKEMELETMTMVLIGVGSYEMACKEAVKIADQGAKLIELCGGFGVKGQAEVMDVLKGKAMVGAVRYDIFPGYDNTSGDERWVIK